MRKDAKPALAPSKTDLAQLRTHVGQATALLKALSNETRLLVLCTLGAGELSVSELNARIPMSQSALSQQLAVLRREGLVLTRRKGQTIYYSVAQSHAGDIIATLRRIYCRPNARRKAAAPRQGVLALTVHE